MNKSLVFPGLGANQKMYSGPWLEQREFEYIDWPLDYIPSSIPDLAEHIVNNLSSDYSSVIGSSLGGMVALEVAKLLRISQAFLLGSAVSYTEVNSFLIKLTPLASITPLSLSRALAGKSNSLLPQMYSQQNPEFIRAMVQAIPDWEFSGNISPIRIHGSHDHIIHCANPHVSLGCRPSHCYNSSKRMYCFYKAINKPMNSSNSSSHHILKPFIVSVRIWQF